MSCSSEGARFIAVVLLSTDGSTLVYDTGYHDFATVDHTVAEKCEYVFRWLFCVREGYLIMSAEAR